MYDEHGIREPEIIERTIGEDRLERIQEFSTQIIAKEQQFEELWERLELERAANDDSPYS